MTTELLLVAAATALAVAAIGIAVWRSPLGDRIWARRVLRRGDPMERGIAAFSLATSGRASVQELRRVLSDPDPEVRAMALLHLTDRIPEEPAILELLVERIRVGDPAEVTAAASAVERAGAAGRAAAPALIERGIELERAGAVSRDDDAGTPPDADAMASFSARVMTTQALGYIGAGCPEVAQLLLDRLTDDPDERIIALDGLLAVVRHTSDEPLVAEAAEPRVEEIAGALGIDRKRIVETLMEQLDPEHDREGQVIVLLLGELGAGLAGARRALLGALGSEAAGDAAAMALEALGLLGADARGKVAGTSAARLLEALQDADPEVRAQAAWSLGDVDPAGEEIVRALAERLRADPYPTVRWSALQALGRIGPPAGIAAPEIVRALEDPSWVLRWSGAHWVAMVGPALLDELEGLAASGSPNGRAGVRRVARVMRRTGAVRLSRTERKRLDHLSIGTVTEPEIALLLEAIDRGDVELTSDREPGEVYSGDCYYETDDGWQLVVFNDCGQWDYLDGIQAPDGRVTGHDEIDGDMPQVEFHAPEAEASWRAWGIRKPDAADGTRWLDGRRRIPAWNEPQADDEVEG